MWGCMQIKLDVCIQMYKELGDNIVYIYTLQWNRKSGSDICYTVCIALHEGTVCMWKKLYVIYIQLYKSGDNKVKIVMI